MTSNAAVAIQDDASSNDVELPILALSSGSLLQKAATRVIGAQLARLYSAKEFLSHSASIRPTITSDVRRQAAPSAVPALASAPTSPPASVWSPRFPYFATFFSPRCSA